jgi:hypothetical protein
MAVDDDVHETGTVEIPAKQGGLETMKSRSDTSTSSRLIESPRAHWLDWAETLRRYQLDGLASWLLEAGRPLVLLSAQMLYMGRPFLGESADALARTLESDDEARAFASFLDGGLHP